MAITFSSTQVGSSADYLKYLYANPIKMDKYNAMTMLDFSLAPGASFVKLNRGSYITISSVTYPNWFTGYITNDPQLEFLGADKNGAAAWGYKYQASSDEVILNTNSLGIWKPFTNMTQGAILKALVNAIMPGVFDMTQVQDGITLPQYLPDPNKKFNDVVNEFTQAACYRFYAKNHALFFRSQDADPVPYTVNGNDKLFTPSNMSIKPSADPIINDCLVIGAVEPQDYVAEYFVGDGLTGAFPLTSSVFGVESMLFLDDNFSSSSIDTTQRWTLFDTAANFFQVNNGYLNVLGGTGDMSQVHLDSISLLPLQANLRLTHGDYDFVNSASRGVNGVIGGLWTQTPNTSLTGCVYGIRVFNQTNLVPDSDLVNTGTFWTDVNTSGNISVSVGSGAVRGNAFRYTGTGAATPNYFWKSSVITVVPSTTYTLSGYIDATKVTVGTPKFVVFKPDLSVGYGTASQTAGVNGRVSATFTVPAGITQVVVLVSMDTITATTGQNVFMSDPQLELGSTATAYETNNTGAMDTRLMPVVNGVVDRTQWQVVDFTKRYTLRTLLSFQRVHRTFRVFRFRKSDGTIGSFVGELPPADVIVATTYLTEIDPVTGVITQETGFVQGGPSLIWSNAISFASSVVWATYVAAASNDLHCTLTNITLSLPLQAALDIQSATNQAAGYVRKQVGPNEIDGFDGLSPIATVVQSGGASATNTTLGTPQYNAGNPTLTFFKNSVNLTTTVPGVGDLIRLRYRRAGAALGRVRDFASVATEATNWGDSGVRSITRNDLNPKPRNSSDCQAAAAAIVSENNYVHYEGTYQIPSNFVSSEPMSGMFLAFTNMPSPFFNTASFTEMIQQVSTSLDAKSPEVFTHTIAFGKQQDERVRKLLSGLQQNPNSNNTSLQDSTDTPNYIPPSSVGLAFAPDVPGITLNSVDASNLNFNTNQITLNSNFLLQTAALSGSPWFGTQLTSITDNSATVLDPIGGHTATKLVCNGGTDPTLSQIVSGFGVLAGQSFVGSVWVLGSGATVGKHCTLFMYNIDVTEIYTQDVVLTADWQRIKLPITWATTNTSFIYRLDPINAVPFASGDTVYVWGPQCQTGLTATDYVANSATRGSVGGFEVRYSDDSWGCDPGKNLIVRATGQTFSVPRNNRGKVCFARAFDTRNKIPFSEDLTAANWTKDGSTVANANRLNPDGQQSLISTLTPVSGNKRAYCFTGIVPSLMPVVAGAWVKGTAGDTAFLIIGNNVTQNFSTTMALNGKWQRFTVAGTFDPAGSSSSDTVTSNLFCQVSLGASPVQITRVNVELNTLTETVYCKTAGSAYGALSRFPALMHIGLPLVPAAPTASISAIDPLHPVVNVTLPTALSDVWGVEIRASDNSTVLYHQDLTSSSYLNTYIFDNTVVKLRSLSFYVYTYNLLGEYSTAYNATLTIPTPTASSVTVDDSSKLLFWTETNPATSYQVDMDATDATMTHIALSWTVAVPSLLLSDPIFFNQRWFRVTPIDALGNGAASAVLSHVYIPTGVVEFNANEVAVIPAPTTPTTDPVVPPALSDYPRDVIDEGWGNYKGNRLRYF